MHIAQDPDRNPYAQSKAGGSARRDDDHGGHLIAAMFGGPSGPENLFPQNAKLNQKEGYRKLEREWEALLKSGAQVFVDIYVSAAKDGQRPDAIYGSYIVIGADGAHRTEKFGFSFANESSKTQEGWDADMGYGL